MDSLIFRATGRNGNIDLYANRLIINNKLFTHRRKHVTGDLEIYLDSLRQIRFKDAQKMTWGYMQIETSQNKDELSKATLFFSPTDPYTINFSRKQQAEFNELKRKIDELRNEKQQTSKQTSSISVADELTKLVELKEKGILSLEEFESQKARLLG